MKMALVLLTAAVTLFFTGCTSCETSVRQGYDFYQIDKIAVVDVVGPVGGEAAKNQIADIFVMELLKKGYSPIERAQVQLLLKEQKFQASDVTSAENVARAGEILNVPVVVVINIPKFQDSMTISAKMLDVEDGSILWMGSASGSGDGKMMGTILGAAAGAVIGGAVTGEEDRVLGAVGGGVLGGVAGNLLSPDKERKAREVIKKICQSLPARK